MSYGADKLGVEEHTHRQTHTQTQAITIQEGQNWPRVKTKLFHDPWCDPVGMHKGISICAEPCGMWNSSTDARTQTQAMTIPEFHNWLLIKKGLAIFENDLLKITDVRMLMGFCLPCRPPNHSMATSFPSIYTAQDKDLSSQKGIL